LVAKKGLISITTLDDFRVQMTQLLNSETYYNGTKNVNSNYIMAHKGATEVIVNYIKHLI
jgi:hypothetical protein